MKKTKDRTIMISDHVQGRDLECNSESMFSAAVLTHQDMVPT